MQRSFFAISMLLFFAAGCDIRRTDKLAGNKPLQQQMEIKDPTTVQLIDSLYDFGKVAEGETVEYNFRFKNSGAMPLIVNNVSASCGCTIPEKPDAPVQPGQVGYIKVKFNSLHHPGHAHKLITVSSNAEPSFPDLVLTGEVTPRTDQ